MTRRWLWGPYSPLGLIVAALVALADQGNKIWMLYVYDIGSKQPVAVAPFFDLILVWNKRAISYGLFQQDGLIGRLVLVAFAVFVSLALIVWLARITTALTAIAIGLNCRRGRRQRHRPGRPWRGGRFLLVSRIRISVVRLQYCRCRHSCRGYRTSV